MEALMIATHFMTAKRPERERCDRLRTVDLYRIQPSGVISLVTAIGAIGLFAFGIDLAAGS